ncbi:YheU family protein [Shewanella psychropiezotolerans]|uniref:YheU family protein n=1 Tax=Shewanella psychropiezotolerans TaxID=2593655 RepID=A0ABX5WTU0_9GAMM|nr:MULTISPECIES: YheU family protein [Shewanella]MPY25247.1 YheU family protein [Shewanella sp. YLB-07]QDO82520.1 YheU family protein [Shewanella psychropiezotolerans]
MLVPYDALLQLPSTTMDNLIKEYLLTQVEDGGFSDTDERVYISAIERCKQLLKQEVLVVEFSEDDESIAIKHKEHLSR